MGLTNTIIFFHLCVFCWPTLSQWRSVEEGAAAWTESLTGAFHSTPASGLRGLRFLIPGGVLWGQGTNIPQNSLTSKGASLLHVRGGPGMCWTQAWRLSG